MLGIILGIIGFMLLYIFDLNKILWQKQILNVLFAFGLMLLGIGTFLLYYEYEMIIFSYNLSWLFIIFAIINLLLIFYALFGALPFKRTYIKTDINKVVDTGLYALCRHPGVLFFGFFYLFLYLSNLRNIFLWSFLLWTIMDIIHVWIQDQFIFPKALIGYTAYQKNVPFLIPTIKSIKQMIKRRDTSNDA